MKLIRSKNKAQSLFGIIAAIAIFICISAFKLDSNDTISAKLPAFSLPSLFNPSKTLTNSSLEGHVFLLNIWASWCGACEAEHATLLLIAQKYHIPIYGIAYKDPEENAKDWLKEAGNPYALVASDSAGSLEDTLHIDGTPDTFLVDKKGIIRYQQTGTISQEDWETILFPLFLKYEKEL